MVISKNYFVRLIQKVIKIILFNILLLSITQKSFIVVLDKFPQKIVGLDNGANLFTLLSLLYLA